MQHPRTWGTFPHLFGEFVRDRGVLDVPEAVRKSTAANARQFGLHQRGTIEVGCVADIAVIDLTTIGHPVDYGKPEQAVTGVEHVLVGGAVVVEAATFVGERRGRVLRGPGAAATIADGSG
jgi:N-acyl-D-aspartate/D-glutamate deacylase